MQANNKETGEVFRYTSSNKTGIVGKIYKNGLFLESEVKFWQTTEHRNYNFVPETPKSELEIEPYSTYIKFIELNPDFELSEDNNNWCVETGSTGKETLLRVFVPTDLQAKCISNRDNVESKYFPLYELIMYCFSLPTFTGKGGLQYLEEITEDAKLLLEYFSNEGVIIDYKYPQIEGQINLV